MIKIVETFYDKDEDILNVQLKESGYWKSVELPNGVVIDISKNGTIVAIEFIRASETFSGDLKMVIEAATAAAN